MIKFIRGVYNSTMTSSIAPWNRPAYQATGGRAKVMLIAFADRDLLDGTLELRGVVPAGVPTAALDLRTHRYVDSSAWIDKWRANGLRNIAEKQLGDLTRLDAAPYCYSIGVELDDPADLTHLQLAWAIASRLAQVGAFAFLDAYACNWLAGTGVAVLEPNRPFAVRHEVSLIAETEPVAGFGHPVHTRGMIKFARPDLIAGVPFDRIEHTGQILNHLAQMLADGHQLTAGQQLRFDGRRALRVTTYEPNTTTPDVSLANAGLLLVDA
jgi:hypothetical protein